MNTETVKNWLIFLRAPGIGPGKGLKLLDALGDINAIFNASPATLKAVALTQKEIAAIVKPEDKLIATDLAWLEEPQHHLITLDDALYPTLLKEIHDPPLALFVDGDPTLLSTPQLSIVGSRNPSHAGMDNAFDFAKYLSQVGLTITSGLALGIDTESHKGALEVEGKTIAVMGTGIDKIYPATNKALAKRIVRKNGCVISEFSTNMPAKPENFPRRNRIISGLSTGVLVVEATIRSGSLITAGLATEQGREVFAIPGSIHNPLARGCHTLIRQGAKLVETAQDIIEELGPLTAKTVECSVTTSSRKQNNLDSDYKNLLKYVDYEATSVDLLVERSGFPTSKVSSMMLLLELQNCVKSTHGGYIKNV